MQVLFSHLGKGPLSDHSTNSFEGHFAHVGGSDMIMNGDSQPKIARLVTTGFLPPNDTDIEPEQCAVAFYYYNLGIPSDVGQMKFILKYDKMLIDMNIFTYKIMVRFRIKLEIVHMLILITEKQNKMEGKKMKSFGQV